MGKVIRITLLSVVILALLSLMLVVMTGNFDFKSKSKLIFSKEYELTEVNDFIIDVKSKDILIEQSKDDKIHVEIYAQKENAFDVKLNEDKNLEITQNTKINNVCIGICFGSKQDIVISLPKEFNGKFDIDATSADIESTVDNKLDYKIKLTSGDIEIENVNSIKGKSTSGDIEIGRISSSIDFKTTSGDIDIDDIILEKDSSISVISGDIKINNITDGYVETSVKSGDVKIKNNDRHAEYVLKITTTSGDITVK